MLIVPPYKCEKLSQSMPFNWDALFLNNKGELNDMWLNINFLKNSGTYLKVKHVICLRAVFPIMPNKNFSFPITHLYFI